MKVFNGVTVLQSETELHARFRVNIGCTGKTFVCSKRLSGTVGKQIIILKNSY